MIGIMLWRRLDLSGHEIAKLEMLDDGWKLSGTAIFASQQGPAKLDYVVNCDAAWRTNSAQVRGVPGGEDIDLTVSVDAERRWRLSGIECASVAGSTDIDLGFSPSTNLLPIRRLALAVGDEAEVKAAWLPFPALQFEPLAWHEGQGLTYRVQQPNGPALSFFQIQGASAQTAYNSHSMTDDLLTKLASLTGSSHDSLQAGFEALTGSASFPAGNLIGTLLGSDIPAPISLGLMWRERFSRFFRIRCRSRQFPRAADASWQISAGTQAFQLTLPPQGLTEAMHKSRNLAVADILPGHPGRTR